MSEGLSLELDALGERAAHGGLLQRPRLPEPVAHERAPGRPVDPVGDHAARLHGAAHGAHGQPDAAAGPDPGRGDRGGRAGLLWDVSLN